MSDYNNLISQVQNWIYRNGRQIEISLWNYFFRNGSKEDVLAALMEYQNDDGGFGHALEADNWNPESTPITTEYALQILLDINFTDMNHPIYEGIWKYLNSGKDLLPYGWRFNVPGNNNYPHAPWWNYNESENEKENYGVTAAFCAFILKYGDKGSSLYQTALRLTDRLINALLSDQSYGDMGLEGLIKLVDALKQCGYEKYDVSKLESILSEKISNAIERDTTRWVYYGVRPSNFINSPQSPFYQANKEIVHEELKYLLGTKPQNDVWPITWTWFGNMEQYSKYFYISENWWKTVKAIEKMRMLNNFGMLIHSTCPNIYDSCP